MLNFDGILFNCRNHLRTARKSGLFFEKKRYNTLCFCFIGEKLEDGIENLGKDKSVTTEVMKVCNELNVTSKIL